MQLMQLTQRKHSEMLTMINYAFTQLTKNLPFAQF